MHARDTSDAERAQDAALVESIAGGDRDALAALYERHAGALLAIGLRILGERREAEDLVHDVFLEVWRRAHAYDGSRASVRAWLVLMMRSRSLDRRKSHAFAKRTPLARDPRVAPASEGPAMSLDRSRVARALTGLPAAQREVLILGYFEGLSSSEIAERVGVPIGTVKSRVAAALAALRAQLARGPAEDGPAEDGDEEDGDEEDGDEEDGDEEAGR